MRHNINGGMVGKVVHEPQFGFILLQRVDNFIPTGDFDIEEDFGITFCEIRQDLRKKVLSYPFYGRDPDCSPMQLLEVIDI